MTTPSCCRDHEQLRPSTAVHALATENVRNSLFKAYVYSMTPQFNYITMTFGQRLDVSLFERLTGFIDRTLLTEQRRMRPIIRELLTPIYLSSLTDNPLVSKYPKVKGMVNDLYFFDHEEEEKNLKDSKSKINEFEAQMCAKLAAYLIKGTAYTAKQM